ncbi:hypothetical protein KC19_VG003800 [Ceratodon purpureus]|uniref:Uncharacterized protein n=1 Tax=Ceratodon purpureus TaxID=3225 RepID=A0A8T0HKK7_CERPU|nr:hypothetical protein KC19_VG003800 [Ceratodon purpureus]
MLEQSGSGSEKSVNGNVQEQALRERFLGTLHVALRGNLIVLDLQGVLRASCSA